MSGATRIPSVGPSMPREGVPMAKKSASWEAAAALSRVASRPSSSMRAQAASGSVRVGVSVSVDKRKDLNVDASAQAVVGMMIAAILHGLRKPDEEAHARFDSALIRLLLDGVSA